MRSLANQNETSYFYMHLYDDYSVENLDPYTLADYLRKKLVNIKVDVRPPLVENCEEALEDAGERFARTRVRNLDAPKADFDPLFGEIKFEEGLIRDPSSKVTGVLYDGFSLQEVFRDLIPEKEMDYFHVHIIFTNRLFGTWERGDHRYHARVSVYGFPSLISTTGIVEAPAKPKEFYRLKRQRAIEGQTAMALEELKEKFRGKFVDYDDERLTEIMKGYVMQSIFYHFMLDPFCGDKRCRLYNAHWQEEVLKAQLSHPEFCGDHESDIEELNGKFQ